MIAGLFDWVAKYALVGMAGLLAMALLALGVQSYRLKSLQASIATDAANASEAARKKYEEQTNTLNVVAANLVHTQKERDDALKASGRKVIQYVSRPGPAVQCFDDDGLQLIAELARGKAADSGASAGAVPGRAAGSD